MNTKNSIPHLLKRLWRHIDLRRRGQFGFLLILMLLASIAEMLSIGSVLPFLGVLTGPEHIFALPALQSIFQTLNLTEPKQILLPITAFFILATLLAGAMRILLLWVNAKLSFAVGADLSLNMYRRTLYQPYVVHCARNSSELIDGITVKSHVVIFSIIFPTLTLVSAVVMLVSILMALLAVQPVIALAAFGGFGLIYMIIGRLTRGQLSKDSECIARESSSVLKSLQEGLGGIRDVLVDGTQNVYCEIYRAADYRLRNSQGNALFISASPRYIIEALGMILISALAYSLASQPEGIVDAIPILGALALGAQRLLPILQQAYGSWTQINSGQASLREALELLDQPLPSYVNQKNYPSLSFERNISFKQVDFFYEDNLSYVLKNVSLTIAKGSRVGLVGITGSGKSTLVDILMGLLEPKSGALEVDGIAITDKNQRSWQAHIAHVPQAIFLADTTIEENIAFGVPKGLIDIARVRRAAEQAQIADTIEKLPGGYQTCVGERGVRLSGGQRQRLGIARALYKKADVIIFDEATSALDSETEEAVMDAINNLSSRLTLIFIAHRITTLKNCTQIFELNEGAIKTAGDYDAMTNALVISDKK